MDKKKKRTLLILSTLAVIVLSGIVFYTSYHKWNEATCETPKTCSICGKTEGDPLGHKWEKATCETPKTCSICGKTEGESLGHEVSKWKTIEEPTCSKEGRKEGTCSRCKETVSESLDKIAHVTGDWEVKTNCIISAQAIVTPGEEVQKCKSCGKELNSREYKIELTTSQRNAILKAYDSLNYWHCGREYLINELLVSNEGYPIEDATFAVEHMKINWDEQAIAYAKKNGSGESKNNLTEDMLYYGFNQDQINKALAAIGY